MKHRYSKIQKYLKRKHAVSRPLSITFKKVNQIVRGWIYYFKIGSIKVFLDKFGHDYATRYDVFKKTKIVYRNLMALNTAYKCRFKQEDIYMYKCINSRLE